MNSLFYGCGQMLKSALERLNLEYHTFDFTDSNPNKWGTKFIYDKKIKPNNDIDYQMYDFCVVGSGLYSEEIITEIKKIGFSERMIIPENYLSSYWERWKKINVHKIWKEKMNDEHITVMRNWAMFGENAECIVKLTGLNLADIKLHVFDLYCKDRNIEVYNLFDGTKLLDYSENNDVFLAMDEELLVKIVVNNAIVGIPWCIFSYNESEIKEKINRTQLAQTFLTKLEELRKFPFYDEDYTVIKCMKGIKGTILDVGANYGQSMYAFYQLTDSNIVSIEVAPDLCEELVLLKELIDNSNRIQIINSGVSSQKEILTWYEPTNPLFSGSFDKDFMSGRNLDSEIKTLQLECNSLDKLIKNKNDIWFLKLDVEGFEYETIRGAQAIIEKNYPVILIEQNERLQDIKNLLQDKYEIFYYNVNMDKFYKDRVSCLNCWLIPRENYRNERTNKIIYGRL